MKPGLETTRKLNGRGETNTTIVQPIDGRSYLANLEADISQEFSYSNQRQL
jgi:hypothetical protein